jgi:mono/diheme cytochrome c family protein
MKGRTKGALAAVAVALLAGAGAVLVHAAGRVEDRAIAVALTGGDPARAPDLLRRHGCAGCHRIPGVMGARGLVGPPLAGLRARVYVGGLPNSAANLVRFILDPRGVDPRSPMPATGITSAEARDVAAYLYSR